jgi:hypothetical protein
MATRAEDPLVMLANDIAGFTHDPLGHALYAYPWGEGVLTDVAGPRDWQCDVMEDIREHLEDPETRYTPLRIAVASGHGIGKSAEISMICKWGLDTCDDCRIVVTANTEAQLLTKTSPELTKWAKLSITADWFKSTATKLASIVPGHEDSWRADLVTWSEHNTEAFAGLHNQGKRIIIIFDESSKIADKVWEVAEGALTDEQTEIIWIAFGNPTQATGRFRECFGKHRGLWKTYQIDSRTVEGTNKAYLDEMVATYGEDSDLVKVRVRGMFPSTSSLQFMATDAVEAARKREVTTDQTDPLVIGVDVARFGDDRSTIYFRRGRDARSIKPLRFHGLDTMQLAAQAAEAQRIYKAALVCVDEGGIGAGVVDRLRQMNVPVAGIQFGSRPLGAVKLGEWTKVANRRAEMWAIMREWMLGGAIPDDQDLADDLTGVEYSFNVRDEIQLEKKEHMKARGLSSPDDGDGLALTFAVPVLPTQEEIDEDEFGDDGRSDIGGY